ncbi:MAG: alpha/beta hydrolase [Pyrinomonadaceae bacterium]|nr:alpha/beta hydrolase [Sphingobacteriaceae bacterium]
MEYQEIVVNKNRIHFRIKPDPSPALTVIFIHGFPFNKSIWDNQLSSLPEGVEGIAYDIRGFGNSSSKHSFFSIDRFAQDLLSFINEKGIKNYILCGISMGGYIALRAYELSPNNISGLILSDTNCVADSNESRIKRFATVDKILAGGKEEFTENFIKDVFNQSTIKDKPQVVGFLREVILGTSDDTICGTLLALAARTDTSHLLPHINVPVLIIRGVEDKLMSEEQTQQLVSGIKQSTLINIKKAGHLPNLENPDEFNSALNTFLSKHFLS